MGYEYRRLNGSDEIAFYELRLKGVAAVPSAFGATLEETQAAGSRGYSAILESTHADNVIFGAFHGSELVGVVGIQRPLRTKSRHRASVWGMYVSQNHQGQGIGGKLLDLAIAHAKDEMKASTVYLTVESSNASAIKLYESRSFQTWGREPKAMFYNDQFFDEDHMTLDLLKV